MQEITGIERINSVAKCFPGMLYGDDLTEVACLYKMHFNRSIATKRTIARLLKFCNEYRNRYCSKCLLVHVTIIKFNGTFPFHSRHNLFNKVKFY
jgi:hypothetical protein